MRFIGIDIGSEKHFVAIVDEAGKPLRKPTPFAEDDAGYKQLRSLLGEPSDTTLVAMEATGHYWQNLFAFLHTAGFKVALLNPTRTAASRVRICAAPRRTRSTPSGSRASRSRSAPHRRRSRTRRRSSFASSCACAIVSCRTSATERGRCIARSI